MKRIFLLALSLALVFTLISCNSPAVNNDDTDNKDTSSTVDTTDTKNNDTENKDTDAPETNTGNGDDNKASTYTVTLSNEITVEIGALVGDLITKLGEPIDYMEAASCIHEGMDKVYTYEFFSISVSPTANGGEYIHEFALQSDEISINGGLTIGADVTELTNVFGDKFEEKFGIRTYSLNGANATVIVDNDIVTSLSLTAITE